MRITMAWHSYLNPNSSLKEDNVLKYLKQVKVVGASIDFIKTQILLQDISNTDRNNKEYIGSP